MSFDTLSGVFESLNFDFVYIKIENRNWNGENEDIKKSLTQLFPAYKWSKLKLL